MLKNIVTALMLSVLLAACTPVITQQSIEAQANETAYYRCHVSKKIALKTKKYEECYDKAYDMTVADLAKQNENTRRQNFEIVFGD